MLLPKHTFPGAGLAISCKLIYVLLFFLFFLPLLWYFKEITFYFDLKINAITQAHETTATSSDNGLQWTSALRMNQIQVIGTHNSYHREVTLQEKPFHALLLADPENYYYSHAALDKQFEYQSVRSLELDIWADPDGGKYARPLIHRLANIYPLENPVMNEPGIKVMHISDVDVGVSCYTFIECLQTIRAWSQQNRQHVPIPVMIEFKTSGAAQVAIGGTSAIAWNNTQLLDDLDSEIRSVFRSEELLTPDHIRQPNLTLEESILQNGWPDLDSARGRVMFCMDDGGDNLGPVREAYVTGRPNLEGRVLFTQSQPGEADCAFQKLNTPTGSFQAQIQDAVKKGYWVRTRADIPVTTILSNDTTSMRDAAFSSGAQMVTTDWPAVGMGARYGNDYVVRFEGGKPARCNPITAGEGCDDLFLEPGGSN